MNFADLLAKMKSIDENLQGTDKQTPMDHDNGFEGQAKSNIEAPLMGEEVPEQPTSQGMAPAAPGETPVEECGSMPMPSPMASTKQQDNVTMNLSMNGSGAGGIRDLMAILKNIEQGGDKDSDMVIGMEEYANEPKEMTAGIDVVTPTGNDIHSKGIEAPKVNGGGNPMQETLMAQLANLYQEVKLR
jgi:hypothetical protein